MDRSIVATYSHKVVCDEEVITTNSQTTLSDKNHTCKPVLSMGIVQFY